MSKSQEKQPTKEQLFLRNHARKIARSFELLLDADTESKQSHALGRIEALRSVTGDLATVSGKNLTVGVKVGIWSE